ncbi:hypothetical protein DJ021_14230 [Phenylobacterium hankyongense]|uniref:Tail fiber domain-containing protein n=1 Tax=Phenylobacterium hankyongense TaxID=1813876 RepID=A0A328B250_9CAUL|nr:hypothetical protein [Phenylobacterium hankyongense]RAK60887.1 hypothetical protein DJ021_14230 [Phenylobacterium hankyongense]
MSFKIGGSASKSNTTSNSSFNNTTTPIVPQWASDLTQNVAGRVGGLTGLDPQILVAPVQPLQQQASAAAGGLTGSPWNFDAAANLTRGAADTSWLSPYMSADTPSASGGTASSYIDSYMNPYLHDVVDATAADLDANAGQVRAKQALDLAGSGAFGGSGAALTQSMTEGELARARATSLSSLRSQGYNAALGAAAGDAERATQAQIANAQMALQDSAQKVGFGLQGQQQQLQAANQLTGLSSAYDANQRANIATQADLGDTLRNIDQEQRQAPVTSTQQIVAMLSGLPINLFTGQQQQGTESKKGSETKVEVHADATKP